jgi:hypothetical protein
MLRLSPLLAFAWMTASVVALDAVVEPRAANAAPCNGIPSQRTERRARELYYFTADESRKRKSTSKWM